MIVLDDPEYYPLHDSIQNEQKHQEQAGNTGYSVTPLDGS